MIKIEGEFPQMESEINYPLTYLAAVLTWIIVLIFSFLAVFTLYELLRFGIVNYLAEKTEHFFALITMVVFCTLGSYFIAAYYLRAKKNNKYNIIVNDKGALIFCPNGKILQQFLYSELCSAKQHDPFDITLILNIKYNLTRLTVYIKGNDDEKTMQIVNFQWEYYILKNKFELYQHFLKGVQNYRPDLKIQYSTLLHFQLIEDKDK